MNELINSHSISMGFTPSKRRLLFTETSTQFLYKISDGSVILQVTSRKTHLLRANYLKAKRIYRGRHRNSHSKTKHILSSCYSDFDTNS